MTDMVGRENLTQLKESLQTDVYNIDQYSKGGRHRIHNPFPLIIPMRDPKRIGDNRGI
jgi:hypothetical protein